MKLKSVLICTLLIVALVSTACSNSGEGPSNTDNQGQSANEGSTDNAGKDDAPQLEKLSLSLSLGGERGAVLPKPEDDFVRKAIEEKFNVELEVDYLDILNENYEQKMALKISSGDAPDLWLGKGINTQDYTAQGVLADLSEYATSEKMPNYYKWFKENYVQQYQVPGHFTRLPIPEFSTTQESYYIRTDWLKNLNLEIPTNYEELTNVMRAFTHDDPDGNNKDDTYGITAHGDGKRISHVFPQFKNLGLYGYSFIDENGDWHDQLSDPLVGAATDEIRKWIAEGLVDPNWFLNSATQSWERFAQGKVGMVYNTDNPRMFAFESQPDSYYNQLKKLFPEAEIAPFNPFPGTPVQRPYLSDYGIVVNKKTADNEPEKVERLMAILDWIAGEEGYLLTQFGIEGKHYTREGNKITLIPEAFKADIIDNGNFLSIWSFDFPREASRVGIEMIDPAITDRDREILNTVTRYGSFRNFATNVRPPEGIKIGEFRNKQYEYLVKLLFEDKDSSNWKQYRYELMTTHRGDEIFTNYVKIAQEVGQEVNDWLTVDVHPFHKE